MITPTRRRSGPTFMPFAPLRLPRAPCHVHLVGALAFGFVGLLILFVYLGVWALQLWINAGVAVVWAVFALASALIREPTRLSFLFGFGSEHPAAAHRGPAVWRGYDRSLLDDDPPTAPIPVQLPPPEGWAGRLGVAVGRVAARILNVFLR
jgi:hypothetical protein